MSVSATTVVLSVDGNNEIICVYIPLPMTVLPRSLIISETNWNRELWIPFSNIPILRVLEIDSNRKTRSVQKYFWSTEAVTLMFSWFPDPIQGPNNGFVFNYPQIIIKRNKLRAWNKLNCEVAISKIDRIIAYLMVSEYKLKEE